MQRRASQTKHAPFAQQLVNAVARTRAKWGIGAFMARSAGCPHYQRDGIGLVVVPGGVAKGTPSISEPRPETCLQCTDGYMVATCPDLTR